jgi:diguanylate cyclase (GGDEF)-like protein/PAS domain S-box-containing protein
MILETVLDLRGLRRHIAAMYDGSDREAAHLRAAQLVTVLRLTPYAMLCNLGGALLVWWAFHPAPPAGMGAWVGMLALLALLSTRSWWRTRHRHVETASSRATHRATRNAAALATVWSVMLLLWFPQASPAQQLVVAALFTGMLGAGTFMLSPLPYAALAYAVIHTVAALIAMWRTHDIAFLSVAGMLILYAPMVMLGSLAAWRKSAALISSQKDAQRQERMLTVLLQDFEQHADEALWETGSSGHLTHLSPRLAELLGVAESDVRSQPLLPLLERRAVDGVEALQRALDAGHPFREQRLAVRHGDGVRHIAVNGKRLLDERGRTLGWRGVIADVTDKVAAEWQLRQLAHTDSLTGLANRFTLRDALAGALRQSDPGALLMVDLDHFKVVNDSLGHSAGDELLKCVAQRLRETLRTGDLVARLGGDEFAVLMTHSGEAKEASTLAERLIDALQVPIDVQGRHLRVGASVGIALFDAAAGGVDDLLVQADTALYAAKEDGRGRHAFYSPAMGEHSRRRVAVEEGLRHAVLHEQLSLHWQPKVDIERWSISGVEALMRWEHPALGRVNPAEFIPIAEQTGLIDDIGRWALHEACRAAAGPLAGLCVAVNLSPAQLRDTRFVTHVRDALRESGLNPAMLELEITESVLMDDVQGALEQLHALRGLGVRVALDDFGVGYSSLAYLRRFPFDTLKIDRDFVNEVLLNKDARAIVRMIAQLASTLGMRTVCEGVETAQQLAVVAKAGCDEVQGYLVSAPKPLHELRAFRAAWQPHAPEMNTLH